MNLFDIHRIYFLGIGGIGMSALARFFNSLGAEVYGYDRTKSNLCSELIAEGMHLHFEEDLQAIPADVDLVVWTPAIPPDHSELQYFLEHGFPVKKRAEVLGIISDGKRCVAVAGTHGKTTTTTLCAHLMRSCQLDATAFLGGIAANFSTNFVQGDGEWVVAEADEYDRSFLHLHPEIAIVNAIDPDHLEIYGTATALVDAYEQFILQLKPGGTLLYKAGLALDRVAEQLRSSGRNVRTFGIDTGDFHAENLRVANGDMVFDVVTPNQFFPNLHLPYPGKYNVENALAALAATLITGGAPDMIQEALSTFRGVKRRFEFVYRSEDRVFIDDYAHHPAELEAVIAAARMLYPNRPITGIFQPHLYTRTRDFADGFARALEKLDEVILLEIYPARERPIPGVDAQLILNKMNHPKKSLISGFNLIKFLENHLPAVLLTMGAGDIDQYVSPIRQLLEAKNN